MIQRARSLPAPDLLYKHIQHEVSSKTIHPLKASQLIATAIQNGHCPPEVNPVSRRNLLGLIRSYIRRDMSWYASDEIARCLKRGRVDEYTLLHPIADAYVNCLLSTRPAMTGATPERVINVNKAARFIIKLHAHGKADRVLAKTYDRLLEAMYQCIDHCRPIKIIPIAIDNGIDIDRSTRVWNIRLHETATAAPHKVLIRFKEMNMAKAQLDEHSVSIILKALRTSQDTQKEAQQIIGMARHLGLYNEFVAVAEMSLLKDQGKYQELLNVFSESFGPETLMHFGFLTPRTVGQQSPIKTPLKVGKQSLSLVIDALVRLNPAPKTLRQLWIAYLKYRRPRPELWDDEYSVSIFIRAFSNHPKTLFKALVVLERMRKYTGGKPNVITYTHLIDGFARMRMMDFAIKVLRQMQVDGVTPNEYTWKILIRGYEAVGDSSGLRSCQEMLKRVQAA